MRAIVRWRESRGPGLVVAAGDKAEVRFDSGGKVKVWWDDLVCRQEIGTQDG